MELTHNLPTTLVVLGATGDLTKRKLIPSLYHLDQQGMLPDQFQVIAFARRDYTDEQFRKEMEVEMEKDFPYNFNKTNWHRFAKRIVYHKGNFDDNVAFTTLADRLNQIDAKFTHTSNKLYYLAVSPDTFETAFAGIKLTQSKQNDKYEDNTKVIIEKPFGNSLDNYQKLNALVTGMFKPSQIYRIDHLLGKETVQNMIYFRRANPAITCALTRENIESVDINYFETIGIGSRGKYYDNYGQLLDMVQNHLLQMATLTFMNLPQGQDISNAAMASAKAEFVASLKIADIAKDVVRGQYIDGVVDGKVVQAYTKEEGVPSDSKTETFVKINCVVESGAWKGLPITFTTGKRMHKKLAEVVFNYMPNEFGQNKLVFRIQPDEGINLRLRVKKPYVDELEDVQMKFRYTDSFPTLLPEAYEKILLDVIRRNDELSVSNEELEAAWKFVEPIQFAWEKGSEDLKFYPAGSDELIMDL